MSFPKITESKEELDLKVRRMQSATKRTRLHALLLAKTDPDTTRRQIAEHLKVHYNTVGRWFQLYEQGGLEQLLQIAKLGAPSGPKVIPSDVLSELKGRLDSDGFCSYKEIHTWLICDKGLVGLEYNTVWHIVRRQLGAKLKRARPSHQKKTLQTPHDSESA